ncbi:CGNR zinc finger domain-containing protein [Frondihabitans sp. 762G35]|uniref:CGNR zinc finger domain-containing protein n=1 Tax=Frondihabitans sp. 762G35 TaxID=1446794 RepID=UPI000E706DF0|nr:CGNR zinc finger domain-containing protein [Frondihabitans sp. 762G35]
MLLGQWFDSPSGTRWHLDAGAVSLDFAYLGGFDDHAGFGPAAGLPGPGWDGLLVPADLEVWLGERFDGLAAGTTERELQDARGLRDAIARLATSAADGHLPDASGPGAGDIDTLNLFAALPDVPPSLPGGRRQAGAGRLRLGQALSSLARDAVRLFAEVGFTAEGDARLRRCAADDCRLIFHDDSRAGSRRWCSMQKCGNRAKVRAHRARAAARANADATPAPAPTDG